MSTPVRLDRGARTALGFGVAVAVLVALVLALDPSAVIGSLASARPGPVGAGIALSLAGLAFWSEAYRILLAASGLELGRRSTFVAFAAGQLAKNLLPMGGATGSAVMGVALGRVAGPTPGRPAGANFAVVAAGELVNVFASVVLVAVGGLALVTGPVPASGPGSGGVAGGLIGAILGVVTGIGTVAVVVWHRRSSVERGVRAAAGLGRATVGRISGRSRRSLAPERIDSALAGFYGGFEGISGTPRAVLVAGVYTLLGWATLSLSVWTTGLALGAAIPPGLACLFVPAVGLAAFVPLPGGVGGVEVALTGLLAVWGLPVATAAAVAVLFRVVSYWIPTLVVAAVATAGFPERADPTV